MAWNQTQIPGQLSVIPQNNYFKALDYFPKEVDRGDEIIASAVAESANLLAQLPGMLQKKKAGDVAIADKEADLAAQTKVGSMFDASLSGQPGSQPLSSFTVGPSGTTYDPARGSYYQSRGSGATNQGEALRRSIIEEFRPTGGGFEPATDVETGPDIGLKSLKAPVEAKAAVGSVWGKVPDGKGGWKADPNDITDANVPGFSASRGFTGADIQRTDQDGVAISSDEVRRLVRETGKTKAQLFGTYDESGREVKPGEMVARVVGPDGTTHDVPIIDSGVKGGRLDLSPSLYTKLGGPMNKNGGLVSGIQYSIVPRTATLPVAKPVIEPPPQNDLATLPVAQPVVGGATGALANFNPVKDIQPGPPIQGAASAFPAPGAAPASPNFDASLPVRRPLGDVGFNPRTGETHKVLGEKTLSVLPGGKTTTWTDPRFNVEKADEAKGKTFRNREELDLFLSTNGLKAESIKVAPEGFILESATPMGQDVKGRAKLTDSATSNIENIVSMSKGLAEAEKLRNDAYKRGSVGPLARATNVFSDKLNMRSEDRAEAQGRFEILLLGGARALQGPGVLSDSDLINAKRYIPNVDAGDSDFKGSMKAFKAYLANRIEANFPARREAMTEDQIKMTLDAYKTLTGKDLLGTTKPAEATGKKPLSEIFGK